MCRIAGFWDFNYRGGYSLSEVAEAMRDSLSHGGPDDAGLYIEPDTGIALTHRRLSIIDLSKAGHQPMEFGELVIAYNGEVYNFWQIRHELEREGYNFISSSDTEVILKAFHRWGLKAIEKFRGMFAIALWNKKEKILTLIRDRLGVKPLYYYFKDGLFMFASELKAFHKHPGFVKELDPVGLSLYFKYGYITSPYTIFKYTYKLDPGCYLVLEKGGKITVDKYWEVEDYFNKEELKGSEEDLTEELEEILRESFQLRLISDVPVGVFLSGGIDSTTVTAILQSQSSRPLKTFTIGFYEKDYNEAEYAKKVAEYLGTEHTELYCTPREAFEIIPELPNLYDEPFGDPSAIPTYLVSKLAKNYVKVALSADGGDEQFCGYTRYWIVGDRIKKLSKLPFLRAFSRILELISPEVANSLYGTFKPFLPKWNNFRDKYIKLRHVLKARDIKTQYDLSNMYFLHEELKHLLRLYVPDVSHIQKIKSFTQDEPLKYMMLYDIKSYLPDDILVKVDRATMGVALEGREPFLDHKIVEFTSRLPVSLKYRNGKSKYILRKILYKYVPAELVDRPKMGFGVPIYEWFKKDLVDLYRQYLNKERLRSYDVFNPEVVSKLLSDYMEDRGVNHNKLWLIFVFELWKERWL